MIIAVYARVSTDAQAERGYSLPTQIEACTKAARELGAIEIHEYIDDGYSGEYIDRPEITRLREALKKKEYNAVIVYDPDRLARNLAHQLIITEEIEKSGAMLKFVSVTFEQSPEGKLFYSIRGAVSAYEKEKIKERTMRGKRGKASKGKIILDAKPYAYIYDKETENYTLNEEEADVIRMMYDMIVNQKLGTALISRELNSMAIPTPRTAKAWTPSTVHRILTDPRCKGVVYSMRYKYTKTGFKSRTRELRPESEWIPITVPAIVSTETWDAAQAQLKDNKDTSKGNLRYDHFLNGLVYCAKCGRKMSIQHAGNGQRKAYYVCNSQTSVAYVYGGNPPCEARRIPSEILDDAIYTQLLDFRDNPKLVKQYTDTPTTVTQTSKIKSTLTRLTANEAKLNTQKDTIMKWYRQSMISDQEADSQLKEIRQQLMDIEANRKRLQNEFSALSPASDPKDIVTRLQEFFSDPEMSQSERRGAVRKVVEKVVAERTDTTWAKNSNPEVKVKIKFR